MASLQAGPIHSRISKAYVEHGGDRDRQATKYVKYVRGDYEYYGFPPLTAGLFWQCAPHRQLGQGTKDHFCALNLNALWLYADINNAVNKQPLSLLLVTDKAISNTRYNGCVENFFNIWSEHSSK